MAAAAADLLVVIHFAFIVFVVAGGLLVLKWGKLALVHLPCALWGMLAEFNSWLCPLTPLEVRFRQAAGAAGYESGFIEHYLVPLIYPAGLTRELQLSFGLTVLGLNAVVYGWVLYRRSRGG